MSARKVKVRVEVVKHYEGEAEIDDSEYLSWLGDDEDTPEAFETFLDSHWDTEREIIDQVTEAASPEVWDACVEEVFEA